MAPSMGWHETPSRSLSAAVACSARRLSPAMMSALSCAKSAYDGSPSLGPLTIMPTKHWPMVPELSEVAATLVNCARVASEKPTISR